MKRSIILFFAAIILFSCEKEGLDYRNKFIGKYDFTIVHSYATYDYSSDRITGGSKTLFYAGSVQKSFFHINRINVDWGSGTVPTEDGQEVQRDKTPLQVDEDGNLEYPEISEGFYEPHYIHGDTICFRFYAGQGMAHSLYTQYTVRGIKR